MVKTDQKLTKTDVETIVRACLSNEMDSINSMLKMREKTMFASLESMSGQIALLSKEFNLKIGAIKGHETRRDQPRKEDDVLAEFNSMDEFQAWLDAQKIKYNGSKKDDSIDQESILS